MEDVQLTIAMCIFKKHMRPVESKAEANEFLTTTEILSKFSELVGEGMLEHEDMYDLLTAHGFIYDFIEGEFRWLIRVNSEY